MSVAVQDAGFVAWSIVGFPSQVSTSHSPCCGLPGKEGRSRPYLQGRRNICLSRMNPLTASPALRSFSIFLPRSKDRRSEEIIRVLRPGGYLILFELIRGQGRMYFQGSQPIGFLKYLAMGPSYSLVRSRISTFRQADGGPVTVASQPRWARRLGTLPGKSQDDGNPAGWALLARQHYWALRKISVVTSVWMEPLAEKICPEALATHGVFLFQKDKAVG